MQPTRESPRVKADAILRLRTKSLCILAFASLGITPLVRSQIAPMPYVPAAQSARKNCPGTSQSISGSEVTATVSGWSLGSELGPTAGMGRSVEMAPGAGDVVLFFKPVPPSAKAVEYRYRLTNYDHRWTVTRDSLAHYHHLPPGGYRFEVQARRPGEAWSSPVATISVVQRHFFYQTWYFYTLLFFGLILLAIELSRQREQLLKGQIGMVLEERNRIASDFHDTLMAGLAAISWQLEATAKLLSGTQMRAAQSCELARKMVAHCQAEARRIIWDLRDSDELTEILSQALSRALAANCSREDIDISFEVTGDEIPIAPAAVHHLVSIGQEAVNNAIRHSGAGRIMIHLDYEEDSLQLSIRDNGCGFHFHDSLMCHGHFGILVMQERARKLGASLHVNSAPGQGTEIILTADFQSIHPVSEQEQRVLQWVGV